MTLNQPGPDSGASEHPSSSRIPHQMVFIGLCLEEKVMAAILRTAGNEKVKDRWLRPSHLLLLLLSSILPIKDLQVLIFLSQLDVLLVCSCLFSVFEHELIDLPRVFPGGSHHTLPDL